MATDYSNLEKENALLKSQLEEAKAEIKTFESRRNILLSQLYASGKEETVKCEGCDKDVPLEFASHDDDANWTCPDCIKSFLVEQLEEKDREIERLNSALLDAKCTIKVLGEDHAGQSAAGWISVDERLPEMFKRVLAYTTKGQYGISCVAGDGKMDDYICRGFHDEKITHWRELSPPSLQENTKF